MIVTRKRKPKSKNYFTEDTEIAIIAYNNEPNSEIRSDIYRKEIHYPLFKLTENIIHTFKFYHTEVNNLEHLQHEIITMLLDRLHKFSPKHNIQDKLNKIIIKEFKEEYTGDFIAYVGDVDRISQSQINDFLKTLDYLSVECMEKLQKLSTRIPVFMYLTDYREQTLKDVITQLEPALFKKVTGLSIKDFELLLTLGVFNSSLMNLSIDL